MRKPRVKPPVEGPAAYYHCISRIVERQFLIGDTEKAQFVAFLREYERFCGVRALTYCVMSDHFHVLVEVPNRPESGLTEAEVLTRLEELSGIQNVAMVRERFDALRPDPRAHAAYLETFLSRMWDISAFMKLLKQRFTQWYNREHDRSGTLWEARFKSVLVEGVGDALATVAAYIDLNPVRAGLVTDPKDFPWCGYAAALAEGRTSGITTIVEAQRRERPEANDALAVYRNWLMGTTSEAPEATAEGTPPASSLPSRDQILAIVAEKGRLTRADYLRMRVRYFADGAVIGSKEFVEKVFAGQRDRFGPKRRSGARRMRGLKEDLYSLRDLQIDVFG